MNDGNNTSWANREPRDTVIYRREREPKCMNPVEHWIGGNLMTAPPIIGTVVLCTEYITVLYSVLFLPRQRNTWTWLCMQISILSTLSLHPSLELATFPSLSFLLVYRLGSAQCVPCIIRTTEALEFFSTLPRTTGSVPLPTGSFLRMRDAN